MRTQIKGLLLGSAVFAILLVSLVKHFLGIEAR